MRILNTDFTIYGDFLLPPYVSKPIFSSKCKCKKKLKIQKQSRKQNRK